MPLRIDAQGMYKGLQTALLVECETLTDWLWTQIQSLAPPEVDRAQIHKEVVMVAEQAIGTVSAGGMMALITEWGSGSLADTTNPAWNEYVNSEYWNELRDPGKHTIRGRKAGSYKDLDNVEHISTGKFAGINLEWKYPPMPAQHWLQGIVERSRPYIFERLVEMIQVFPFHQYIHGE